MRFMVLNSRRFTAIFLSVFFLVSLCFITSAAHAFGKDINIKIAQYANSIDFNCPQGGTYELGGLPGKIMANQACKITGKLISKAQKKYHVMVLSVALADSAIMDEAKVEWKQLGWELNTSIIGKEFFADDGKTLLYDGRKIQGEVGSFDTIEAAQALVDKLASQGKSSWIQTEILQLAKGELTLTVNGQVKATGPSILLIPADTIFMKKVEFAAGYPWHGFADRTYSGKLTCRFGANDAIDCILNTSLENVLAGVVPSEISASADIGALRAQAVAARGEILSKVGVRHLGEGFDTCSEQHCQVFAGVTKYSQQVGPKIAPTAGYILFDPNKNRILDAVYSANCGGHSEASHLVWTTQPNPILNGTWDCANPPAIDLSEEKQVSEFIRNPPTCYCSNQNVEGGKRFRWQKNLSTSDWKAVEAKVGIGRIKDIKDIARGYSGRIYRLTFVGQSGEKTVMKELNIRKLFGSLMSACFIANWKKDASGYITSAEMIGAGFGHGVGMCQTGAQSLAKQGWAYQRILSHYFPGSVLKKWY